MKNLITLIIALFVLSAATAFAQTNTADIGVTAEVLAELNVTGNDVEFGNVQQGSAAQVQANTNDIANSNASAPVAGSLEVLAGSQDYQVSVTQDAILTDGDGNNPLTFTHRVFLGTTEVTTDVDGSGYNVVGGGDQTFDIGGELQAPSAAGSYSTANGGTAQPLIFVVNYII